MLKKFCSILLSSLLAFSVSNKKSDAGLLNSILKFTGASGFGFTACTVNTLVVTAKICGDSYGNFNSFWCMNREFMPIYKFFGSLYAIGKCCDIYDNNNGNNKGNKENENKRGEESKDFSLLNEYKNRAKNKK